MGKAGAGGKGGGKGGAGGKGGGNPFADVGGNWPSKKPGKPSGGGRGNNPPGGGKG
jgi:hypothetical protein